METAIAIIAFIYWAATWSTLSHALLRNCGRGTAGIKLGLFLGPLGCAIAFSLSRADTSASTQKAKRSHITCLHCGGFIDHVPGMNARFNCPYCGKPIELLAP